VTGELTLSTLITLPGIVLGSIGANMCILTPTFTVMRRNSEFPIAMNFTNAAKASVPHSAKAGRAWKSITLWNIAAVRNLIL